MNHRKIIGHLAVNGDVLKNLFRNLTDGQARWKPDTDRWSLLEVVNHLYDEENERTCQDGIVTGAIAVLLFNEQSRRRTAGYL